jgi:DNA-binding FadR family transcriptional regulator
MTRSAATVALRDLCGTVIVGAREGEEKLAHETVAAIECDLFARGWPDGFFLGKVPDLQRRYGLGRWAARQAVAILQSRGVLDIRRGPGGGVYVAKPSIGDATRSFLLFLALSGARQGHIKEVRAIVRDLVVTGLIRRAERGALSVSIAVATEKPILVQLAELTGHPGIALVAEWVEAVARYGDVSARDGKKDFEAVLTPLAAALEHRDNAAIAAAVAMSTPDDPIDDAAPIRIPYELLQRVSLNQNRYAGLLAAKLLEELLLCDVGQPLHLGCELDIGERHNFNQTIVRQAMRMLEDIGAISCQRGRRGGAVRAPPQAGAVIRLLFPHIAETRLSPAENLEVGSFLALNAPRLAACRRRASRRTPTRQIGPAAAPREATVPEAIALGNRLLDLAESPFLSILVRAFGLQALFSQDEPRPPPPFAWPEIERCFQKIFQAIDAGDPAEAHAWAVRKDMLMMSNLPPAK